jgi:hypothetical protein
MSSRLMSCRLTLQKVNVSLTNGLYEQISSKELLISLIRAPDLRLKKFQLNVIAEKCSAEIFLNNWDQ